MLFSACANGRGAWGNNARCCSRRPRPWPSSSAARAARCRHPAQRSCLPPKHTKRSGRWPGAQAEKSPARILVMRRWLRTTHGPAGAGGRIRGGRVRPHPLLPHLVRLVHRVQRKVHEQGSLEGRLDAFGRRRLRGVPVQGAVRFRDEHAEVVCHTRTATMALAGRRGGVNQPPST